MLYIVTEDIIDPASGEIVAETGDAIPGSQAAYFAGIAKTLEMSSAHELLAEHCTQVSGEPGLDFIHRNGLRLRTFRIG